MFLTRKFLYFILDNVGEPSNQNENNSTIDNPALLSGIQRLSLGGGVQRNAHRGQHRGVRTNAYHGQQRGVNPNAHRGQQRGRYNSRERDYRPKGDAKKTVYATSLKKLEAMLKDEPDQLVIKLLNEKSGFSQLLKDPDLSTDFIVLIVKVTARMCQSEFESNKSSVMTMICDKNFIKQLEGFALKLCLQDEQDKQRSRYYWMDSCSFWESVAVCCETVINTIPTVACEILPNLLKVIIKAVSNLGDLTENLVAFENLQKKIKLLSEEQMLRKNPRAEPSNNVEMEPTDDFRNMCSYPTVREVTTNESLFLRKNKTEGKYGDVEQYLDIHYRLLREDFVRPLREGIHSYLTHKVGESKNNRIKVCRELCPHNLSPECFL